MNNDVRVNVSELGRVDDDYLDSSASVTSQQNPFGLFSKLLKREAVDYELQKTGHPDAFCSRSITKRKTILRHFQNISCLITAASLFLAPYQYFFKQSNAIFYFNNVADFVYLLIMMFRARTTYIVGGIEERDIFTVRNRYQNSIAFILDLLTLFPVLQLRIPYLKYNDSFFTLNRQTIIIRLHYILYYLKVRELESGTSTLLYRTTKYVLLSCMVVHYAACGWYGLACSRNELSEFSLRQCVGTSWIVFLPQSIVQKVLRETNGTDPSAILQVSFLHNTYVTSLYWSAATVASTGYGDVRAYTVSEKLFAIVSMVVGLAVLFGMTMGGMTSMLTNIDARRADFVHRYKAFEKEVKRMGVSDEIREMCQNYFDYLWRRWQGEDVSEIDFLSKLPNTHQAKFAVERFKFFFCRADLFADTEPAFIRNLSICAKPKFYIKGQFVQKSGELSECMYFLHHGMVEILDDNEDEVIAVMHPGKLFGQSQLIYDLPRVNSVRCKTNCDIFVVTKQDFRNILSLYPHSAVKLLRAVDRKCAPPERLWPLIPINEIEFSKCLDLTENAKQLKRNIVGNVFAGKTSHFDPHVRLKTVHFKKYTGIAMSTNPITAATTVIKEMPKDLDYVPSFVEFPAEKTAAREAEEALLKNRLIELTVVNPEGRFYRFWLDSMFFIGLAAGLFSTYIAFFTTTPGEQKLYTYTGDDDLFGAQILKMATDTCNLTESNKYFACPPWPFNATAECIRNNGGSFAWRVLGNSSVGYQVRLPARHDISRTAYSFTTDTSKVLYLCALIFIDLPCVLHILLSFRLGVVTPQGLSSSFRDITSNYIQWHGFWLDVLGIFPFSLIFSGNIGCYELVYYHELAFWRLNRLVYFFKFVPSAFARWEYRLNVKITRIRTFKFLVYIYTITHMTACIFYFWACSYISQSGVDNIAYKCHFGSWAWVFDIDYTTSTLSDYVKTMYWTTTTMTSTGYGDITASTSIGRVLALLTMIVGTIMYGWLVAVIASTIANNDTAIVTFRNSMLDTKRYLSVHEVPKSMIIRVMNVRQLEWQHYRGTAIPGQESIGKELSELIQDSLAYENLNKFMQCVPFFQGVDPSFISLLCKHALIFFYAEGEIVLYEGDLSRDLYVIKRGHCNSVTADLETKLDHLAPGDYFGECELFFGCGSSRTVACETACEIIILKRESVDKVLESFPILQAQLLKIQKDEKYRDRVLQAMRFRNVAFTEEQRGSMTKNYRIENIDGEHKIYTERLKNTSGYIFLPKEERNIRIGFFAKLLNLFLLPVTFDPHTKAYKLYEAIRTLLILVTLVIVPLQFAFLPANYILLVLQYILDLLCILDQYVKAHTAYFNHRAVLVSHPIHTTLHYVRTSFMVDLLSWLPFEAFVFTKYKGDIIEQQWRLLAVLRFTRILQIYKVHGYFSYLLLKIREITHWIKHLRNLLYGLLLHHWIACFMFILACPPTTSNEEKSFLLAQRVSPLTATGLKTYCHNSTWIGNIAFTNSFPSLDIINSVSDQYIVSFYWATATLVSVGYGDIHAYTLTEMLCATFIMISGTVFYSFILGGMSASIQTDDQRRGSYKEKISDIKKFFKVYDVSRYTEDQVLNYYYYLWDRTGGVTPDKLFVGLPPSVLTSINQCMYGSMVRKAFGDNQSKDKEIQGFYRLLSTHITPFLYLKNSIICRRNDIGNEMFFIQRGSVGILDENDEIVQKVLGPGQHFGEVALLFAVPRSKTIKALTNCELNVLKKSSLDSVLENFPQFTDRMTTIAEDHMETLYDTVARQKYEQLKRKYAATKTNAKGGFAKKRRIIDRESKFVVIWYNLVIIMSFVSSALCIYQVAYFNHHIFIYLVNYFIDALFLFDMILSFNTSVLDQFSGNIDDPQKINLAYSKTLDRFMLDAISNAPMEVVAFVLATDVRNRLFLFALGRLNRLLRLYRLVTIFADWQRDIRRNAFAVRLYYVLVILALAIHSVAGCWYAFACPNGICKDQTWTSVTDTGYFENRVHSYNLLPLVDSIYWTVSTMTSTGYGDIKPATQTEMIFACFVMVLGKIMIGYILGITAATLANDESLSVTYKQNVTAVQRCMDDHKFNRKLYKHIVRYYEYLWLKNQGINTLNLFPDLSFSLRADIASQVCGKCVRSIRMFHGCPENFLRHVCTAMIPAAYMPGDYICFEGDVHAEMYSIYRGEAFAERTIEGEKIEFQQINEGENFLCESVLTYVRRPCSLRARTYVDVFSLTLEGLRGILLFHPLVNDIILRNARDFYPELHF